MDRRQYEEISWHLTPKWLELRGFVGGKSYENADDNGIGANVMVNEDQAILSMAVNKTAREMRLSDIIFIGKMLHEQHGINYLTVWRKEGRRFPFATKGRTSNGVTEWCVDLQKHLKAMAEESDG